MKILEAGTVSESNADVVQTIVGLNARLSEFWASAHGWAPDEAANLLSKSRLDRQVSLSETLHLWIKKDSMSDGELILAWANLGALLEGTLKTYFSIYYLDFQSDVEALTYANAYDKNKKTHKEPDRLTLEILRKYACCKKLFLEPERVLFLLIQSRRNAIHAFKDRELGNVDEFRESVRSYMDFLKNVDKSVPYPDVFFTH
jgi:hypothetical protein